MDQVDDIYGEQLAALQRTKVATNCIKDDTVPCQLEEGLYLGSIGAAKNKAALKSLNITHVLTVASSLAPAHPDDFVYKTIDVADRNHVNITQYFKECFEFIDEAKRMGGGVLVHCFVGRSRSVTVVVAYLMTKRGMSVLEALDHVRSKRPEADPNSGFMSQLNEFENYLRGMTIEGFMRSRSEAVRSWLLGLPNN